MSLPNSNSFIEKLSRGWQNWLNRVSKNNNHSLDLLDPATRLHKREYLNIRLKEERRRSERTHSPISLIVLDFSKFWEMQSKTSMHSRKSKIQEIITRVIQLNTREIDIKTWDDDQTVRILLVETSKEGARRLAERLLHKIAGSLNVSLDMSVDLDWEKVIAIACYPDVFQVREKYSDDTKMLSSTTLKKI